MGLLLQPTVGLTMGHDLKIAVIAIEVTQVIAANPGVLGGCL